MNPLSARPEQSALFLRRRGFWEAVDSGVLLWRSNFAYFLPFFAIPVWIVAWGLRFLPGNAVYLSYLVLWWLKPFFDRLILFVVSRSFFDTASPPGFSALKTMRKGLLGDLLWRRFSLDRSAVMPIRVLENLDNKSFVMRKKALKTGGLGFSSILGPLGLVMEFMLLFGEILFFLMLTQLFFPSIFPNIWNNLETVEILIFVLFCFNYILVESLCVCMGFGLYINSRVELEGWDLQLLFQNFVKQGSKIIALTLLFFTMLFMPVTAYASDTVPTLESTGTFPENFPHMSIESHEYLEEILSSIDFGGQRDGWAIRLRYYQDPELMPNIRMPPWMENIRLIFSYIIRSLVIFAIAGFLGFVFYWLWKTRREFFRFGKNQRNKEKSYAKFLHSTESPESLFDRAEDFYFRGLIREAWAACLSGCLGAFAIANHNSVSFPIDATEYECLNLVGQVLPGEKESFGELVKNWVLFVYGNKPPSSGAFAKALLYGRSLLREDIDETK